MKTFVVIGMGRFGTAVAKKLCELGHEVLAIDEDEARIQDITESVTHAVIADAKEERVLSSLGVRNYDCAILAIGSDIADSVLITMALKDLGLKEIICKAGELRHKKILLKIGADRVIIPEYESGTKLAVQIAKLNLIEYLELTEKYGLSEMNVPKKWISHTLVDLNLRRRHGITVVGIKQEKDDEDFNMLPSPDYRFCAGDIIVLIGKREDIDEISHLI